MCYYYFSLPHFIELQRIHLDPQQYPQFSFFHSKTIPQTPPTDHRNIISSNPPFFNKQMYLHEKIKFYFNIRIVLML
ncbi:hypothetical protein Lalb_Chr22g0352751 [Lupinus albus]|uniref:Uncharacterized protein n=1 Tax=Lupinus albus TaxID=3870 RepID=A0A6A4NNR1_LUPAL|nr:hypothetical protein Lalb_Chr22g0352751 [Lupinus albus]